MSPNRRKWWKRIEEVASGRVSRSARMALFAELRTNPKARSDYDRTFEALRALEQRVVAEAEIDFVESWLLDDLAEVPGAEAPWWRRIQLSWMIGSLSAAAAAAAALFLLRPPSPGSEPENEFRARGRGDERALAIDVLCPQRAGGVRDGLVPAAEFGCELTDTLSFAYRLDPSALSGSSVTPGVLSLFGVDGSGDVLYYAPTPADPAGVDVHPGTWTPLPLVVRLDVNHEAGGVVVYGLVSPRGLTVEEVDTLAETLSDMGPSGMSDAPWHARTTAELGELCADRGACQSAEVTFTIHEALR